MSTQCNNYLLRGNNMTPAQLRMARSALKIGVRDLGEMADVTTATITRYENERGGLNSVTSQKLRKALETAGVIFIDANGNGPGVRLRDRHS